MPSTMIQTSTPRPAAAPAPTAPDDARWDAVLRRDPAADGDFVFAVRTTGIFCRPSCPARRPRRENVAFHADPAAAEAAGFRACLRCRPSEPGPAERQAAAIARACRTIEAEDGPPDLDAVARRAGMSRFHFQRVFKAVTGLTPKAYADAERARRLRDELDAAGSVTEAIYGAGYNSSGRFYAASNERLGMTPTAFRAGGEGTAIRVAVGACSLGRILVAASLKGVCAISFGDDPKALMDDLRARFPRAELVAGDPDFAALVARVVALVERPGSDAALPLDIRGTAFEERVWQALRDIPAGATASYAEVARRIGQPSAARAVARACAANALAVAVPCHRVVRQDGAPSGYRWGADRKRALLAREGAR